MNGRYSILATLAKGGMGTVHLGRMKGNAGFARLVAIKQLHPHVSSDPELVAALFDEATLAAQIRHPNVVGTIDVVTANGTLSVVFDYIEGEALSGLIRLAADAGEPSLPRPIALAIVRGALRGLEAAHDARGDDGTPLGIVHRDVSPQNVLVGVDGLARVIDFGVAKALGRVGSTRPGEVRGKFSYMAPEQLMGKPATRQVDIYAMGVVLWELLTGKRLFAGEDQRAVTTAVIQNQVAPPSEAAPDAGIPPELDEIVLRATSGDLGRRHLSARELILDLEPFEKASDDDVGVWVRQIAAHRLAKRAEMVRATPRGESFSLDELMAELAKNPDTQTPMSEKSGSVAAVAVPFTQPSFAPPPLLVPAPVARRSRTRLVAIMLAATFGFSSAIVVGWLIVRERPLAPRFSAVAPSAPAPLPPPSVASVASVEEDVSEIELEEPVPVALGNDAGARTHVRKQRPRAPHPAAAASSTADPRSYR
ncbi:MAG: serine/threonine protein kinase [Labilithrix sp.]|nr:serine/threonine protein kinase [Labilithrix sp.]MCW5816934.1 serine/threonine protein kinase [Labilithrix sp.]